MSPSQEQIQHLTQKLVDYLFLYQKCSDKIRPFGAQAMRSVYDEAYREWRNDSSNPQFDPPPGDEVKKAAYFAKCDEVCRSEPKSMHDVFKITFACGAGLQVIQNQDLARMGLEGCKILRDANRMMFEKYVQENPDVVVLPDSPDAMDPRLPPHLEKVFFKDQNVVGTASALEPDLVGQRICFRDQKTDEIIECTVQDCGTSHLKGDWYEIVYDDERELQVTATEMREMLTSRIKQDVESQFGDLAIGH